uniref:Uncharacterized protein n=1 Tax=Guillardia theta TaxID=55529 RepID=A0A7S4KGF4_GUITH
MQGGHEVDRLLWRSLQGGHEVDRLLWRYLQQGTDIMLQHVSGKIRRRLDNMSKSLDYLESNTTMLLQRLRRKGTQQPVDAVEGSDNDTCSVMSSDDTSLTVPCICCV